MNSLGQHEQHIRSALKAALKAVVAPTIPDAQWALENRRFTPTQGTPWLREVLVPQANRGASIGPNRLIRQPGSWLVDLFFPLATGTDASAALVGAIQAALPPGKWLSHAGQGVRIRSVIPSGGRITSDNWYHRPLLVSWEADNTTP